LSSEGRDLTPRRPDPAADAAHRASRIIAPQCLAQDGSLFTPGQPVWTLAHADQLYTHYVMAPDESKAGFLEKLEQQLSHCTPGAVQLAAELLYVNVLPLADQKPATKKKLVQQVLGWARRDAVLPEQIEQTLDEGRLFSGGVAFKTLRWAQFALLVKFVRAWKTLPEEQRTAALNDPWAFRTIVLGVSAEGSMAQRLSLIHLVFPDVFEPIVSTRHRKKIIATYGSRAPALTGDMDRDLAAVRDALERTHGQVDF
jgi:5-methylcytosine-specific restriction enzyme B